MNRVSKRNVLRWLTEGALILISVLLAFYLESKRQDWKEKAQLIDDLRELRQSIVTDSVAFYMKGSEMLPEVDTIYGHILAKDWNSDQVIGSLSSDPYLFEYKNWTLERLLQGDQLRHLSVNFRNSMWFYRWQLYNNVGSNESNLKANTQRINDLIWTHLKFKTGSKRPSDSTILYSDELSSLIRYNMRLMNNIKSSTQRIPKFSKETIDLIDGELKNLE